MSEENALEREENYSSTKQGCYLYFFKDGKRKLWLVIVYFANIFLYICSGAHNFKHSVISSAYTKDTPAI